MPRYTKIQKPFVELFERTNIWLIDERILSWEAIIFRDNILHCRWCVNCISFHATSSNLKFSPSWELLMHIILYLAKKLLISMPQPLKEALKLAKHTKFQLFYEWRQQDKPSSTQGWENNSCCSNLIFSRLHYSPISRANTPVQFKIQNI